ncbi:tripartite tricarboxylate transporter substrate binding protein [Oceanobacillus sp. CF4.6]|uniref:tripartite tricarboxylate transporter substrate binding protein n=1 Tax=Oceanobacillus sp. CF4.6 TaxID=3373080 RepID=UPI003EE5C300
MKKIIQLLGVTILIFFISACNSEDVESDAQSDTNGYPERPVTFYVQYSAGGATDLAYRQFFSVAEKYLGETIVVENVTGGGGTVGLAELAKQEPDGYTLGNTSLQPLTITPHNQTVSYKASDFSYVGGWAKYLYGIAVRKDSPFKTFEDFIKASHDNPGMPYSDSGPGGITTLGISMLDKAEGNIPSWQSVGFDGGGEASAALLGGHVDFGINNPGAYKSSLESGDLRLLVSLSDTKWDLAPDAPTISELGYDFDITSWLGIGGPKGLPEEVIEVWSEVIQKTIEDPEFIEAAKNMDLPLDWMPGDEYEETVNEMYDVYGEIIEETNQ